MTRAVSANLTAHLAQTTTTLATLLHITRTDGTEYFFTSHDQAIEHDGDTYTGVGGFFSSAIESAADLSVDNLEAQAAIESAGLTESDILAGRLDYATFEVMWIDYTTPADGNLYQRVGVLGEVSLSGQQAAIEFRGLMQYLHQTIGRLHLKRCDADLGDTRCGVTLSGFTVTGTVSGVTDRRTFTVSSAPAARGGLLTWTSGANNGLSMEVRSISGSTINLALPMPFDVSVGEAYSVYRGCDKTPDECETVFSNIARFRGFPFLPGNDELFRTPDAK